MTRKVYADVDLTVLVPVRIQGEIILRTDSKRSPEEIFQRILDGKKVPANLEDCQVSITEIAGDPLAETTLDADTILARCIKPKINQLIITDSK